MGLALFALLESGIAIAGLSREVMAWSSGAYFLVAYIAGLTVHSRRSSLTFLPDGALQGRGYIPYFRRATSSLLLLHTDDDQPSDELLGLYAGLLKRGVAIRRVVFLRPEQDPEVYSWVVRFGESEGLQQRLVPPAQASLVRTSFAVVDERYVLLSINGTSPVDGEEYAGRLVLRHLLVLENHQVVRAFCEAHEQLWRRAQPLDLKELESLVRGTTAA